MSDGAGFVLDASALLAHLLAKPGGDVVRDSLAEQTAVMSAVNWAEVLSRLASAGADPDEVARRLAFEAAFSDVLTVVALPGNVGAVIARLRASLNTTRTPAPSYAASGFFQRTSVKRPKSVSVE